MLTGYGHELFALHVHGQATYVYHSAVLNCFVTDHPAMGRNRKVQGAAMNFRPA